MQINWKIRLKLTWWAQALRGGPATRRRDRRCMGGHDLVGHALADLATALGNPVVVVTMAVSLWTATDPTTSGTSDSKSALERTEVKPNARKDAA
ncbi:MAG: phage holin [Collinsella intestinalis]